MVYNIEADQRIEKENNNVPSGSSENQKMHGHRAACETGAFARV